MSEQPDELAAARYANMRWNAPLSTEHADLLLSRLSVQAGSTVLDLGCGWGELLLRALAGSGATGVGVDSDETLLARGRARARELRVGARFVNEDAAAWRNPAERVLCIGSSHALGGTRPALAALAELVLPGGLLLYGDGCWDRQPTPELAAQFDDVEDLQTVVGHAVAAGWRVLHLSTADQREWDDFESTWRAGRQQWLVDHPDDPRAAEVRAQLDAQLDDYLSGYRGVLGFCYLVLARSDDSSSSREGPTSTVRMRSSASSR